MKKKTPPAPHSKWDPNYPYEVDYNDHFETPLRAYEDIAPLLDLLSPAHSSPTTTTTTTTKRKKKQQRTHEQQQQLRQKNTLYDPYYCNGRAAHHLRSLGYTKIKHEKRDFYDDIARGTTPSYNTLITNPPYSCDHKEKCLEYAVNRLRGEEGVPFFLLMPAYVASKRYYRRIVADKNGKEPNDIIYLLPSHRYEYDHPEGTGRDLAPFESIWFCGIGKGRWKSAANAYANFEPQRVKLLSSWEELGNNGVVSTKRRLNPRQRKKLRERMQQRKNDANVSGDVTNNERCRRETAKSETKVTTTAEGQSRKKRGGYSLSATRETLVPSKKRKKSDEVVFSRKKRNFKTTPT